MSALWTDLERSTSSKEISTDICIIGAGAAGLYLSSELTRTGHDSVIIEAGSTSTIDSQEIGFSPVFSADVYSGATKGRFFGMGGSTTHWGGALVPHSVHDLRSDSEHFNEWSSIVEQVRIHSDEVLERLGYLNGADFDEYSREKLGGAAVNLSDAGLIVQSSLLLPFNRKNLLGLLSPVMRLKKAPRVYYNAVAKGWFPDPENNGSSRVGKLVAVSRSGAQLTVRAKRYIVAAGAIESARILLELNESLGCPIFSTEYAPGCYLADHLSLPIAEVVPEGRDIAASLFATRFEGPWMRGFRLLEKLPPAGAPRAFAHFTFSTESAGFTFAKKLLGSVQQRRVPKISIEEVTAGLIDVARLAYYRYAESRIYIPAAQKIYLQLDMEQYPIRENRISLLPEKDQFGRKKSSIHWEITDQDIKTIGETARRFLSLWPKSSVGIPKLLPIVLDVGANKVYDAYHPTGTCRMGECGKAVVDRNLKVWGLENVWVVSTGVLPSAGSANPTFTMLCLAHHLAINLRRT